jgi:16S rRNA processing protein RimM
VRRDDLIVVAEVVRPHGVRGAVRVVPVTDFPDRLLRLEEAVVVHGAETMPVRVERARRDGTGVLMKFSGIDTPQAAAGLRGATVQVPASQAPPLPPGQYYVFQVIGLEVRAPDGARLGEVVDVLRTGSNDVYVVRSAAGPDVLIPAVDTFVQQIDIAAGRVVARLPEWLE